ncbi:formate C-acetyltransferase [Sedimentisphaera salicampi]|uniref:Formate acetyltransferase n=1 Tax=Sedimentisphaera salicampi TaxID=1941349 RepID=A0A1W6LLZ0_9BACT|nr:formate C-acetyltransferase [Sedimentisphaera salicampi]ARN56808.1 Formate acetyltransferase [Sedimentisphaera salicampi]OXU14986.1 Formate acetyltransferase [Sedimentisphaera salicampi]
MREAWEGFKGERWKSQIDVRDFIQCNYTPYKDGSSFLEKPTQRTKDLLSQVEELQRLEQEKGGVLDIDTERASSIAAYPPGYIDKEKELIFGLQTDAPLKRGVSPFGGIRMAQQACEAYGYELSDKLEDIFNNYRTTHNDGVFRVYTKQMRTVRRSGLITGLPDAYGRGRIIGDYRRLALYGLEFLMNEKLKDKDQIGEGPMTEQRIRLLEELFKQVDFLQKLGQMAKSYGFDINKPARNAKEAIQWTYFAYLGAIKEQNGAAMSLGRTSTFFDIYIERDLAKGLLDESGAQELIDDFVLKLRLARQLRTPEYNELFAGDPTWVTEAVGGMGEDGRTLVTKSSFRILNTLNNLNPSPEPNLTVLWSDKLPVEFRKFCARISVDTDSIQYENDDLMRRGFGDDYGIACCVSAMKIGKQMQFFGARANLPKVLLCALNGGRNEITGDYVAPESEAIEGDILNYDEVMQKFLSYMDWLCELYVNTMNVIHYMHDKYAYEKLQMALHDTYAERFMAFGIAGMSVIADSLSAIKHAEVRAVRDEKGLIRDFEIKGDFPKFGNDDDRVDSIAEQIVEGFYNRLCKHETYRDAKPTLSILTITSNVVYGKKTGSTPDGRKEGEPFAPGANPMHNRDSQGALASLNSVAKLPYEACLDGISCTFSVTPQGLGAEEDERISNLVNIIGGYFKQYGHHMNVNVLNRERLEDAMENPGKYPNLTIRVSGYAVNFNRLSRAQQEEVLARTFHDKI